MANVGCNGTICSKDYVVLKKHERVYCPVLPVILEVAQASGEKVPVEMVSLPKLAFMRIVCSTSQFL